MKWFLLVYHRSQRSVLQRFEFAGDDTTNAMAELARFTSQFIADREVEVTLLGARSEDDLRETHRRYFGDAA